MTMLNDKSDIKAFYKWKKKSDDIKFDLMDVYKYNNGKIELIKGWAWVLHITPDDWKEFCEATDKEYENNNCLLFI